MLEEYSTKRAVGYMHEIQPQKSDSNIQKPPDELSGGFLNQALLFEVQLQARVNEYGSCDEINAADDQRDGVRDALSHEVRQGEDQRVQTDDDQACCPEALHVVILPFAHS